MSQQGPKPSRSDDDSSEWAKFGGMGFEFIAAVGLFTAAGYGIDRWLASSPWGIAIGVALGFTIGLRQLIRSAKKIFHD